MRTLKELDTTTLRQLTIQADRLLARLGRRQFLADGAGNVDLGWRYSLAFDRASRRLNRRWEAYRAKGGSWADIDKGTK